MVTKKHQQTDAVFKAIADPTRREILRLLRPGARTVGSIAANFRTSRPAISKHLRLLRRAGLVVTRKCGASSICTLNAKPLRSIDQVAPRLSGLLERESARSQKVHREKPMNPAQRRRRHHCRNYHQCSRRAGFRGVDRPETTRPVVGRRRQISSHPHGIGSPPRRSLGDAWYRDGR